MCDVGQEVSLLFEFVEHDVAIVRILADVIFTWRIALRDIYDVVVWGFEERTFSRECYFDDYGYAVVVKFRCNVRQDNLEDIVLLCVYYYS